MNVYSFEPFGYNGQLISVETDLRRGIPVYDIVGISDSLVAEEKGRIRAAIMNSSLSYHNERILQCLSPADIKKVSSCHDLPMAVSLLFAKEGETPDYLKDKNVMVLGELELSGKVRPVRAVKSAVMNAKQAGITDFVIPKDNLFEVENIPGINILTSENLSETVKNLKTNSGWIKTKEKELNKDEVTFSPLSDDNLSDNTLEGYSEEAEAVALAAAGKHNILFTGPAGCGKTLILQSLLPALTPHLTDEEKETVDKIYSIAGLSSPGMKDDKKVPFRMPYQTASIEGVCGGGPNCHPGEITLAHNGILFLDEAAEFRTSVLQMLRVPLESKKITLSRAGRTTIYPANFQLALSTNMCPCGCMGSHNKICLDSAKSVEMYWKKFSAPLLDRIEITKKVEKDLNDNKGVSITALREKIKTAIEIQRKKGKYNNELTPNELLKYAEELSPEAKGYYNKIAEKAGSPRTVTNILKLAVTAANMEGRDRILEKDLKLAVKETGPLTKDVFSIMDLANETKVKDIKKDEPDYER